MKAITLHQPWASLIAERVKTIETRSWAPPASLIGQRIAIHAGKREPRIRELPGDISWQWTQDVPRGAVVATALLEDASKVGMRDLCCDDFVHVSVLSLPMSPIRIKTDPYGDFGVGRWLWFLTDIQKLSEPIPCRGYQNLWEIPRDVLNELPCPECTETTKCGDCYTTMKDNGIDVPFARNH